MNIPNNAELPSTNIKVPYTFIGDEAFPLLVNILRPYPGKQLVNNIKKKYLITSFLGQGAQLKILLVLHAQNGEY